MELTAVIDRRRSGGIFSVTKICVPFRGIHLNTTLSVINMVIETEKWIIPYATYGDKFLTHFLS